jgi:hypothetical protein
MLGRFAFVAVALVLVAACTSLKSSEHHSQDGLADDGGAGQDGGDGTGGASGSGGMSGTGGKAGSGGASGAGGMKGESVMGGGGSGTGGDSAMMSNAPEPCTTADELRCTGGANRQRCTDGLWMDTSACKTGEVCSAQPGSEGTCSTVAEVCKGATGEAACDGGGVMYKCDSQGVPESMQTCASARHCQVGLASGTCAMCLPGDHQCSGAELQTCDDDGQGFTTTMTCDTVALCNADAGDCTSATCVPGKFSCQDDELKKCNANQTGWDDVAPCGAGLCDAMGGECDVCVPGTKTCDGDTVVTCNGDGQGSTRADCTGTTAQCVGNGKCVQCANDNDCPDPGTCMLRHCDLANGTCDPQPSGQRDPCSGGLCDGAGTCLQCLVKADCGTATCKDRSCNSGSCIEIDAQQGTPCSAGANGRVCDDSANCVACNIDSDCNGHVSVDACHEAACTDHTCGTRIKA